jgi:hypothetical protein
MCQVAWVAEYHTCGKVNPYQDPSRGSIQQESQCNASSSSIVAKTAGSVVTGGVMNISPLNKRVWTGPTLRFAGPSDNKASSPGECNDERMSDRNVSQRQKRVHVSQTEWSSVFSSKSLESLSSEQHTISDSVSCDTAGGGKFGRLKRKYSGRVAFGSTTPCAVSSSRRSTFDYDSD